jgi:hypothetical protein
MNSQADDLAPTAPIMETDKPARVPTSSRVTSSRETGRNEDVLFADEMEIARRNVKGTSKSAGSLADEPIAVIPILPIDEENARQFPAETASRSAAPLPIVPANPQQLQRSTPRVREEFHRFPAVTARQQRIFTLSGAGAIAVIAGFTIGWLAGRPSSQTVWSIRGDTVLPAPLIGNPLGTSGSQRVEKPAALALRANVEVPKVRTTPASAPTAAARKEVSLSERPAVVPPIRRPDAAPGATRFGKAALAPAPVPLKAMAAPSASRALAVERSAPPLAAPIPDAPAVASTASTAPPMDKSAPPPAPVNEARVRVALAKYANAYSDLDAAAVTAVWPSVDQAALRKAFNALDAQQVIFDHCDVQISGAAGRATCVGSAMWRPKIGGGNPHEQNRTWTFVLKDAGGSWQIVKSEAR